MHHGVGLAPRPIDVEMHSPFRRGYARAVKPRRRRESGFVIMRRGLPIGDRGADRGCLRSRVRRGLLKRHPDQIVNLHTLVSETAWRHQHAVFSAPMPAERRIA